MTYNFDPDAWFDRQRAVLEARRQRGELDDDSLARALHELEQRYDEMTVRLDKPFELP